MKRGNITTEIQKMEEEWIKEGETKNG